MTGNISYDPFDQLIISLKNDGLETASNLLNHLIYKVAWTTGSELIGELGYAIHKIKEENQNQLSDTSNKNIQKSIQMVKRVWPDFPK